MKAKRLILGAGVALIAWPAIAQAQAARPATAADLAGKTICWDDGRRGTFGKDDKRWAVTEPGVVLSTDREGEEHYVQIVVLPDGRFARERFQKSNKRGGLLGTNQIPGTVCH